MILNSEIEKGSTEVFLVLYAIFDGIIKVIQNVSQLYCVRHLSQRDEVKINQLLGKSKSTVSAKNKAKIIKDIYGERKRSVYEYGLAEAEDIADFSLKLTTLEERWESLCPGFYQWFVAYRKLKSAISVFKRNPFLKLPRL